MNESLATYGGFTVGLDIMAGDKDDYIFKLNQLFMEDMLQVLREDPQNTFDIDVLYLANQIAEKYVQENYSEINWEDFDNLTKIISLAKTQAQETLLKKLEEKRLHDQQKIESEAALAKAAKRAVITQYCKLTGWKCPF